MTDTQHDQPVTSRLRRAAGAQFLGVSATLISQIVLVPLLIFHWGAVGFGEWVTLTAATSYVALLHLGAPAPLRTELAFGYTKRAFSDMKALFQTTVALTAGFALAVSVGLVLLCSTISLPALFRFSKMHDAEALLVVAALISQGVLGIINQELGAAISACGRYALARNVESTRQLLELLLLSCAIVVFKLPIHVVAFVLPMTALCQLVFGIVLIKHTTSFLLSFPVAIHPRLLRPLLRPMLSGQLYTFCYLFMTVQAPRLIIALALGPAGVASYALAQMLQRIVRLAVDVPAHTPTVELSGAVARGDAEGARHLILLSISLCFWLAALAVLPVVLFGPRLIHYLTGNSAEISIMIIFVLSVSSVVASLVLPCQEALISINGLEKPALRLVILSFPNIFLMLLLTYFLGLLGTALAALSLELTAAALLIHHVGLRFGITRSDYIRNLSHPPFATLLNLLSGRVSGKK